MECLVDICSGTCVRMLPYAPAVRFIVDVREFMREHAQVLKSELWLAGANHKTSMIGY